MKPRRTVAYLGLGTNLGNRRRNLSAARRRLRQKGVRILRQSSVIETEPWGDADQPRFLNQVVEVEWGGTARRLLAATRAVEREGGRTPTRRWGPRVIDVDILLFGDDQVSDGDLQIPHRGIRDREFVQQSLRELGVLFLKPAARRGAEPPPVGHHAGRCLEITPG